MRSRVRPGDTVSDPEAQALAPAFKPEKEQDAELGRWPLITQYHRTVGWQTAWWKEVEIKSENSKTSEATRR